MPRPLGRRPSSASASASASNPPPALAQAPVDGVVGQPVDVGGDAVGQPVDEAGYSGYSEGQPPPPPAPQQSTTAPSLVTLSFECEFGERPTYFVRLHPSLVDEVTVLDLMESVAALSGVESVDMLLNIGCDKRAKLEKRWTGADIGLCDGVHFGLRLKYASDEEKYVGRLVSTIVIDAEGETLATGLDEVVVTVHQGQDARRLAAEVVSSHGLGAAFLEPLTAEIEVELAALAGRAAAKKRAGRRSSVGAVVGRLFGRRGSAAGGGAAGGGAGGGQQMSSLQHAAAAASAEHEAALAAARVCSIHATGDAVAAAAAAEAAATASAAKRQAKSISQAASSEPVLVEGTLEKQSSGLRKRWQPWHFELAGHELRWRSDGTLRGALDLRGLRGLSVESCDIAAVLSTGEPLLLRAPSQPDAMHWAQMFEPFAQDGALVIDDSGAESSDSGAGAGGGEHFPKSGEIADLV